jgi:cell division protein ZapA
MSADSKSVSADAKGLQINVMGREFRVACPENEQKELLEAVDYLNKKMSDIRDNGKVIGLERIAIMAALNIAHELLSTKVGGFDMASIKRRMQHIETMLDQAIRDQSKLS